MTRVSKHYLGEEGREYFSYQHRYEVGARLKAEPFFPYVSETVDVLDFGAGDGGMLAVLPARSRIAIEVNPAARAILEEKGIEWRGSLTDVPSESVDRVVSNHALEHTLKPFEELLEMRRVLRPNGLLVIRLPLEDWRADRHMRAIDHHLYTWIPTTLRNLLTEAGFSVTLVKVEHRAWPPGWDRLLWLPRPIFGVVEFGMASVRRRRNLFAVARPAE